MMSSELRNLIKRMWEANPCWGSPRIVGELCELGIHVAKSTVEKYKPRWRPPPSPSWKTFLDQHVKDLISVDFFIVSTVKFRVLFFFVVLAHHRRRVIHCGQRIAQADWLVGQSSHSASLSYDYRQGGISCLRMQRGDLSV
jgi:hypothetical protein